MPNYKVFAGTKTFWRQFDSLTSEEQAAAAALFKEFRKDPFAPKLGTHKIIRLSALFGKTIWSVKILPNLRALFYTDGERVVSVGIGGHEIYG